MNDKSEARTPKSEGSSESEFQNEDADARQCVLAGDMVDDVEPWPEAVDGSLLLDDLAQVIRRFVVLPKWAPETLALWTVHTYAFELRHVSTYIGIESPERRCGKTTLLEVLQRLVNRPAVTANISSSAFFRAIGELRPTLMIDEADTFLKRNDTLRGILNAGYTRETAYVVRATAVRGRSRETPNSKYQARTPMPFIGAENIQVPSSRTLSPPSERGGVRDGVNANQERDRNAQPRESGTPRPGPLPFGRDEGDSQGRHWQVTRFSCWCPKVIAMIGRLPGTLADRCIMIRMQRKMRDEQCERLRTMDAMSLRRKCARFVRDHAQEISTAQPPLPSELNDRAADIWEPLLALADLAGGKWPETARQAAVGLSEGVDSRNPIASLLVDITLIFAEDEAKKIFTTTLVQKLNWCLHRPWAELTNGRKITELWLAKQLRPFGIRSSNIWIGNEQRKGYHLEDFNEVCRRYVPDSEIKALMEDVRRLMESEKVEKAKAAEGGEGNTKDQTPGSE
jgi:hypothetical protein